jgi:glutaredoxin
MIGKSLLFSLAILLGQALPLTAKDIEPQIYYFGASGCDYCANGLAFIKAFKERDGRVQYRAFDIIASPDDAEAFVRIVNAIGLADPQVPMTIIGHHVFVGYESDDSTGEEIRLAVEQCRASGCSDVVKGVLSFGPEVAGASQGWTVNRRFAKFARAR